MLTVRQIKMPRNVVLFLGAGFSAPLGLPVMNSFLAFADSSKRLESRHRDFLGRLLLQSRRANSFLESSPTNLEDMLSFAEMADRLGLADPLPDGESQSDCLRHIIRRVYTTVPDVDDFWNQLPTFDSLLGSSIRDFQGQLQIVTTNYDINAECILQRAGRGIDLGFAFERPLLENRAAAGFCGGQGTKLFKLHGSVNWWLDGESGSVVVEDRIIRVHGQERFDAQLPRICSDFVPPSPPLIIPPSFLKPDLAPIIKGVWKGAATALASAHDIVFVGYSFPESDREMMYFLATAFTNNALLRSIHIVDPNADRIVTRLRSEQSKAGSHFKALLHAHPGSWTDTNLEWAWTA